MVSEMFPFMRGFGSPKHPGHGGLGPATRGARDTRSFPVFDAGHCHCCRVRGTTMVVYDCRGVVLAGVLLGTVGVKLLELIALAIRKEADKVVVVALEWQL